MSSFLLAVGLASLAIFASQTQSPQQQTELTRENFKLATKTTNKTTVPRQKTKKQQILEVLTRAGFKGTGLRRAFAVVMAESSGNPNAHNPDASTGDNSYGLFQINMLGDMGPERRARFNLKSNEDLFDPDVNARVAYEMSNGGRSWSAWTTYGKDTYKKFYDDKVVQRYARESMGKTPTNPTLRTRGRGFGATPTITKGRVGVGDTEIDVDDMADDVGIPTGDLWTFQSYVLGDNVPDKVKPKDKAAYVAKKVLQYNFVENSIALDSTGELQKIFDQAVKEDWPEQKFRVEFQKSSWYRNTEGVLRTRLIAEQKDPASFNANINRISTQIQNEYKKYGVTLPDSATLQQMARNIYLYQQDTNDFYKELAKNINFGQNILTGIAGQAGTAVLNLARNYGVSLTPQSSVYQSYVRQLVGRETTENDIVAQFREEAIGRFPALADRLRAGANLKDIADPYFRQMSSLLDIDEDDISFDDPLLQMAFNGSDPSQGPKAMSLYDFRRAIRKDPRWANSPDAQTRVNSAMSEILRDFGIVF